MAKKPIELDDSGVVAENASSPERDAAWEKFLANYEAKHPTKFAERKAAGAFDAIPPQFKFPKSK